MNAAPSPSSQPSSGRLTGFVLGFVTFICMIMIGAAGYVKYKIDHAELIMAAPGSVLVADQEVFDQLRRALGYSGFAGYAQNYIATHDGSVLSDMRAQVKSANDAIAHLPNSTPGESRHDAQAIVGVFQTALQKAEKSGNDPAGFTTADMVPLYAALPVLDSRLETAAAANRLAAENRLQFWSMLLTLVCWASLIIAASLAVGIYLTLRDRNSAPLRALAQSVKNMARGDMRTSIWGMERQDMVGELARAIDLARYNFSQLPDMSLLSEQGPVRLRFEGNTRSLFEAMMRVISRDSEQVRLQAMGLTEAIHRQEEAIALISSRVEAVLHNVEKRGLDGDHQIRNVLQNIVTSAQGLRNAQEHAADQLNRILPFLQERAQGMAEITQITGKQVAQVLASLTLSERVMKTTADQSEGAIRKLSSVADDLGERMFGAVNLLQASGKVLTETTEKTQSRLNEAIQALNEGLVSVSVPEEPVAATVLDVSPRLEQIAASLEGTQKKIDERLQELVRLPETPPKVPAEPAFVADLLSGIKAGFETTARQVEQIRTQCEQLRDMAQTKPVEIKVESPAMPEPDFSFVDTFLGEVKSGFETTAAHIQQIQAQQAEQIKSQYEQLRELALSRQPIEVKIDQPAQPPAYVRELADGVKDSFEAVTQQIGQMREQLAAVTAAGAAQQPAVRELTVDVKTGFETVTRQVSQIRDQIAALTVTGAAQPGGSEQLQAQWYQMAGQIEATRRALEQAITQQVERISSRLEALSEPQQSVDPAAFQNSQKQLEEQTQILEEIVATLGVLDTHMQQLKSEIEQQKSNVVSIRAGG